MLIDQSVFHSPQSHGFRMVLVTKGITPQCAHDIISTTIHSRNSGAKGIWFGISSPGGEPGSARLVADFVRSIDFPVIGHIHSAFSESACLAAAFPARSIAPAGSIGFHQASMNLGGGSYAEEKLSDLLHQVRGHNNSMVRHLEIALNLPEPTIKGWVYSGASFVGKQAMDAGIVSVVCDTKIINPAEYAFIA